MRRAYLISPFSGDTTRNIAYALKAMHYLFAIGYSPYASHILFAASGCLDDSDAKDREFGMAAGYAFLSTCEVAFAFMDLGVSRGMRSDLDAARRLSVKIDYVSITGGLPTVDAIHQLMLPHAHLPCAMCQVEKENKELKNA
jgi:hypothetical protein